MSSVDTKLAIAETAIVPASMRGLKGDIQPIDNGPIIEMEDWSLRDMTDPAGRLFEGTLTCTDLRAPPVWGMWKGQILNIDFPDDVYESLALVPVQLRPHAAGSLHYLDADEAFEVPANDPRATFRVYRPKLRIMIVEPWKVDFDEWEATNAFTLKWKEAIGG